jgi:hypothetical protein
MIIESFTAKYFMFKTDMSVNCKREINTTIIKLGPKFLPCHYTINQIHYIGAPNKFLDKVEIFRCIGTAARIEHAIFVIGFGGL